MTAADQVTAGYSVAAYGRMIADQRRSDAYWQALQRVVRPGATVLDIGTGCGLMALMACRLGARRVYAIEPNDAIHVGREIARANGYGDRITFIQDLSTAVTLPERVDVIVSDLRGVLPLSDHHIPSIIDARRRHLAEGGIMIPARDTMWASGALAPGEHAKYTSPWDDQPFGLDMKAGRDHTVNTWRKARIDPAQMIVPPSQWASLEYVTIDSPNVEGRRTWSIHEATQVDGIVLWFDTVLVPGIGFSNAPDQPELIYGSAYLPLPEALPLAAGQSLQVQLGAYQVTGHYVWQWTTETWRPGEPQPGLRFQQSTFHGAPLAPERLHKRAASSTPALNDAAAVDRFVMDRMDGQTTLSEIAQALTDQYPTRFPDARSALTYCGDLALRYSR